MTTVYTKSNCVQCDMTKRMLDKLGVDYHTIDMTENPATIEMLTRMGYRSAPVVITDEGSWAGFQPDKISELAA